MTSDLGTPRLDGDALTIAFSAPAVEVHGVARLGISAEGASGLVLLFHRGQPAVVHADGGVALPEAPQRWTDVAAAGIDLGTSERGHMSLSWAGDEGALDLELAPVGALADVPDGTEEPLAVAGTATIGDERLQLAGLGQRTRSWAAPDWERTELARTLQVWLPSRSFTASATRAKGGTHAGEDLRAWVHEHRPEPHVVPVGDPRLSTTSDAEGRQRSAGLELWITDDGPVHRVAGEARAGTTLDLGRMRLDTAFFVFRSGGEEGTGRYDVLRRTS